MAGEDSASEEQISDVDRDLGLLMAPLPGGGRGLYMDGTAVAVHRLFLDGLKQGAFKRGHDKLFQTLHGLATTTLPECSTATVQIGVSGEEGANFLREAIAVCEAEGNRLSSGRLPAYEWLWIIRRLSMTHWAGVEVGTNLRLHLAGLALARNTKIGVVRPDGMVKLTSRHAGSVAFLVGYALMLGHLHMAYRMVGKGAVVFFNFETRTYSWRLDRAEQERVIEYDKRVSAENVWGGLGVHLQELRPFALSVGQPQDGPLVVVAARRFPEWADVGTAQAGLERYVEHFLALDDLFALIGSLGEVASEVFDAELGALLALAAAYPPLFGDDEPIRRTVRRVGYSVTLNSAQPPEVGRWPAALDAGLQFAASKLPSGFVPGSRQDLWAALASVETALWPMKPGPLIVPVQTDAFAVDWYTASIRLMTMLRYSTTDGSRANVRAAAFERSVQRAIEADTDCAPAPWLAELLNRHLRIDGKMIGEIDAAATLPGGDVHLVISCKSYPFTEAYERGDHSAVRNVNGKLEEDALKWLKFVARLSRERKGDNFAIPHGARLVPVVVTPRVLYTEIPSLSTRVLDPEWGPRIVCGFGELLGVLAGVEVE